MGKGWWWVGLVAAAACRQEDPVAPAALEVTPSSLDFGAVGLGSEATLGVTLSNTGGAPVALLSAALLEGDPDLFRIDANGVTTIEGGASGEVLVTFLPEEQTLVNGQMQLRTDLDEGGSFVISLLGRGGPSVADGDGDGYSIADGDCDDGDGSRYPGADEVCDGRDNDCNGVVPGDEADADGDGWLVCEDDCDDANGARNPGAEEICDDIDNDCNDVVEDRLDADGDGVDICGGDCDDEEFLATPGRPEVCDGIDNDCVGLVDDIDADLDGHTVCSAAGDCDDNNPNAYPIVVAENGDPNGAGTDADPLDTIESGLANLDQVCRTVVLEPGTYDDVVISWTAGVVDIVGRTGDADDVTIEAEEDNRAFDVTTSTLRLRHVTITGGSPSEYLNQDGGAISVSDGELELENVRFTGNTTDTRGGAVAALSSVVTLFGGCEFDGNDAGSDGGGLYAETSTVDDDGTTYLNNSGSLGGAIRVVSGDVSIDDAEIRDNTAEEGAGISISAAGSYTIEHSRIWSNEATAAGGGIALRDVDAAESTIRNNEIQDNFATEVGGGVAVIGAIGAIQLVNDTFAGNVSGDDGAAVAIDVVGDASGVLVVSNVMHSNDGPSALYAVGGAFVAYNTGWFTNSGVHFAGDIVDIGGEPLDSTNLVRDPELVSFSDDGDPENDDLALQAGSPEIDAGPPAPEWLDPDGSTNDRGHTGGPSAN